MASHHMYLFFFWVWSLQTSRFRVPGNHPHPLLPPTTLKTYTTLYYKVKKLNLSRQPLFESLSMSFVIYCDMGWMNDMPLNTTTPSYSLVSYRSGIYWAYFDICVDTQGHKSESLNLYTKSDVGKLESVASIFSFFTIVFRKDDVYKILLQNNCT
jgi:hypothetical protein